VRQVRAKSDFKRKKKSVLGVLGSTRGVFRASDVRKRMCWGFLGVPAAFFEFQTQEKKCVGGSWACSQRFSIFTQETKCVRSFWERPRRFFELQIQVKKGVGGSRRFWDARLTRSSSWRGKSRAAPDPGLL